MSQAERPRTLFSKDEIPLPQGTGSFGLWVFLSSLAMIFGATLVGYIWIRYSAPAWPPAGMPPIPGTLAFSTILILVSSATVQWGYQAARRTKDAQIRLAFAATLVLGLVFLGTQLAAWSEFFPAVRELGLRPGGMRIGGPVGDPTPRQFAFLFFTLTGLHAAHLIGGLAAIGLVLWHVRGGLRSSLHFRRIQHSVIYWHFLDVVWVVMYAVLLA